MRLKFTFIIIAILLAFIVSAFAQIENIQISGKVLDVVSENELAGVLITITNLNTGNSDTVETNSAGYWEFNGTSSIDEPDLLPLKFEVSSPYPNPFNPKTKIDFSMPNHSPVKVTVFNILGELIETRESLLNAGMYSIEWNGHGAAGVYFINVKTKSCFISQSF